MPLKQDLLYGVPKLQDRQISDISDIIRKLMLFSDLCLSKFPQCNGNDVILLFFQSKAMLRQSLRLFLAFEFVKTFDDLVLLYGSLQIICMHGVRGLFVVRPYHADPAFRIFLAFGMQ